MQKMKFAKAKLLAVMLACLTVFLALPMTAWADGGTDVVINIISPAQFVNAKVGDEECRHSLWSNIVEDYIEWEVSGNLPEGYRIEKKASDSEFVYTPTKSGKYNFTLTVKGKEGTDVAGKSCSRDYTLIIEPAGGCKHDDTTYPMMKINGTPASCQKDGRDTYWYCNFCEKNFLAADGTSEFWNDLKVVTAKNHTDSNTDGKCDDCAKPMPVFKKVTEDKEIVYGGSYVFVTKIGEQYYALTEPNYVSYSEGEGSYLYNTIMDAKPVALSENGTFDYATLADNKAMIIRTDFAAICPDLDNWAAMPRYGLSTALGGHRYTVVGDMGPFHFYTESASKYGNYIVPSEDGAKLASVYSWGESGGKGGDSAYLNAFKATKGDDTKVFFGINNVSDFDYATGAEYSVLYGYTVDTDTYPVYLYKMVFPGTVGSNSYTVSDGWDNVTKGSATAGGVELSNIAGLTNAVNSDKIDTAITEAIGENTVSGDLVVTLTGDINVKNTSDGQITYSVTPALAVVDNSGNAVGSAVNIDNASLNGTPITVTLNTDGVVPNQIVHELSNGGKEFYYPEETANAGQQTFAIEQTSEYEEGETFVTFATTEFSDFRILTTPEADDTPAPPTKTALTAEAFTFTAPTLTYNTEDQIEAIKAAAVAKEGVGTVTVTVKQNDTAVSEAKNAGEYAVCVSANEGADYAAGSDIELGTVTIAKATVTGEPKYTKITAKDKTLADAGLTTVDANFSVEGTVKWVNDNGDDLALDTKVTANTSYKWLFTPTDTNNYLNLDGSIKLWRKSSGGGGGSATTSTNKPAVDKKDDNKQDESKQDENKADENKQEVAQGEANTNNINKVFGDTKSNDWYAEAAAYAYNNGLMKGSEKGNFDANSNATRGQIVTILHRLEKEPSAAGKKFADIKGGEYYAEAVAWAAEGNIVAGYEDGSFGANDNVTREELATILYRYATLKNIAGDAKGDLSSFADGNTASAWATEAMQWAVGNGLLQGDNGTLNPQGQATRAEIATILMRFCENLMK